MSLFSLFAMMIWGMVLGLGYQIFSPFSEKSRNMWSSVLFYGCAGFFCFIVTALFLYAVNGGKWGLYGFLAMLLGFWFYYLFFRRWGRHFSSVAERMVFRFVRGGKYLCCAVVNGAMMPFEKIVDKGMLWARKRNLKKQKKQDHDDMS